MIDREKVIKWLDICGNGDCPGYCPYEDAGMLKCQEMLMREALALLNILLNQLNQQAESWESLRSTIKEMRDNGGTGTQQGVCRFLANLMDLLEKLEAAPW